MRSTWRIGGGATVAMIGIGLAVLGIVLPYVVKKMPSGVTIALVGVGSLLIVVPSLWLLFDRSQSSEPSKSTDAPGAKRVGIANLGPGSHSETHGSRFGSGLDTGIENQEGGTSTDWGSTFGKDQSEGEESDE